MKRGNIVIADLRPNDPQAKVRPVLVVQNDHDNRRMNRTIVALVTGNTKRSTEATQLLIDTTHSDWGMSGLLQPSVVNTSNLYTVDKNYITRVLGSLSDATMKQIDECLKAALGIF